MSDQPRLLLHIGHVKCASTFIQHGARSAARDGKIFAYEWAPWDALINEALRDSFGPRPTAFPRATGEAMRAPKGQTIVATNECLVGTFPEPLRHAPDTAFGAGDMRKLQERTAGLLLQAVRSHFPDHEIQILMILRAPKDWLGSIYRNLIVMGLSQDPRSFMSRNHHLLLEWYDVDRLWRLYSDYFGAERVTLLPIEMLREDPDRFAGLINSLSGCEWLDAGQQAKNIGLSPAACERIRQFWQLLDDLVPVSTSDWSDASVKFKSETWRFLFEEILNHPERVEKVNKLIGKQVPEYPFNEVVCEFQKRMSVILDAAHFSTYHQQYLGRHI